MGKRTKIYESSTLNMFMAYNHETKNEVVLEGLVLMNPIEITSSFGIQGAFSIMTCNKEATTKGTRNTKTIIKLQTMGKIDYPFLLGDYIRVKGQIRTHTFTKSINTGCISKGGKKTKSFKVTEYFLVPDDMEMIEPHHVPVPQELRDKGVEYKNMSEQPTITNSKEGLL